MRVILPGKPFHRSRFSTLWIGGTPEASLKAQRISSAGLFLLAAAATATISSRDPFLAWGYSLGVFLLGGYWAVRIAVNPCHFRVTIPGFSLGLISIWGFGQLAAGATVYRYATWDASLRTAALGATAFVASRTLAIPRLRFHFLRGFAWFGFVVSLISVTAFFTSPGRVLWIFLSPYPDVWGPFLSRNDFAGFLELSFPVALWLALLRGPHDGRLGMLLCAPVRRMPLWAPAGRMPLWAPAWMLAAGMASASRAGSALLVMEAAIILMMIPRWRAALRFGALAFLLIAITGAGTLLSRLSDPDPLRYRREIAGSTLKMIAEHPWRGFGLGTYAQVYPAYATFDTGAVVEHAHNCWLEWATEGGTPLALLWLVFAIGIAAPAARSVWGLGILAALVHALVDYPFARFGLTAWNFALIGALSAAEVREVNQTVH
jgi:O-antigen ligase